MCSLLALQVNGWEPLIQNVTDGEQREFVRKLTQVDLYSKYTDF